MKKISRFVLFLALVLSTGAARAALPRFTHPLEIAHPFLPLATLKADVLEGREGGRKTRVERSIRRDLHKTFRVGDQNVETLVMEDREFENGQLSEVTLDYVAQGDDGAVYYFGEDVDDYEHGKVVGHSGAWLFGEHTQVPGVLLPARPKVGDKFQSEDVPKITREDDEVLSTTETVTVPAGTYKNCLKVKEVLSDGAIEYKYYAEGVGCIREASKEGELRLVSHTTVAAQ